MPARVLNGWRSIAALAALLAFVACGRGPSTHDGEKLVRAYDDGLIAAYRLNDPAPLKALATNKEIRKVTVLIDLKRSAHLVLESALEQLQVTSVRQEGPSVLTIEAKERWRYFDRPLDPGKPPGTVYIADMSMRYRFVKEGGGWKMDEGMALASDYVEPKGFKPDSKGTPSGGKA